MAKAASRQGDTPAASEPDRPVLHATTVVALALVVGTVAAVLRYGVALAVPGSLAFSVGGLAVVGIARRALSPAYRDRTIALSAMALTGAAPFIAFACDQALTVPTWDSRPLEGLGPLIEAFVAMVCLTVGPTVAFVAGLPVGMGSGVNRRAFVRFLAVLAVLGAAALTSIAAVRRARFPDPDGYFPSLPSVPVIEGGACGAPRCVGCPGGQGERRLTLVTAAGARDIGDVRAPCDKLEARYDAGRDVLLIAGDEDRGGTLHAWAPVQSYALSGPGSAAMHISELRGLLAPPLPWILEAGLGIAVAVAALLATRRRGEETIDDARATAGASFAFAAVVLLTTPLATAAWARLV